MSRTLALAVLLASCTFACGGAPPASASAAATTAPPQEPEPTTVEEAVQQVERAKQALARPTALAAESTQSAGSASTHDAEKKEPEECRALRSLERATQALCRLAGQDDPRCKDAAQTLEESRSRVKCP